MICLGKHGTTWTDWTPILVSVVSLRTTVRVLHHEMGPENLVLQEITFILRLNCLSLAQGMLHPHEKSPDAPLLTLVKEGEL